MELNKIYFGDCLFLMNDVDNESVDMIICDLPYGIIDCKWDVVLDFKLLWNQYERIIKDNGAIVLFGSQPFTTDLINSNRKLFRYEIIWEKSKGSNFLNANKMPNKTHENICVFYKKQPIYNPIKYIMPERYIDKRSAKARQNGGNSNSTKAFYISGPRSKIRERKFDDGSRMSDSLLCFSSEWNKGMHPTQKPVLLLEYLIKTFTNEKDIVLDNCIGSGTTAVAAINTKRNFIGIEKNKDYYNKANERIKKHLLTPIQGLINI